MPARGPIVAPQKEASMVYIFEQLSSLKSAILAVDSLDLCILKREFWKLKECSILLIMKGKRRVS